MCLLFWGEKRKSLHKAHNLEDYLFVYFSFFSDQGIENGTESARLAPLDTQNYSIMDAA